MRDSNKTGENDAAARQRKRKESAKPPRFRASWMTVRRAIGFILFAAAISLVMTAGQPPLSVELGKPSPRDFRARTTFTSKDLQRTRAAKELAMLSTPAVFRSTPEDWQNALGDLLEAVVRGETSAVWQQFPEGFDGGEFRKSLPLLQERLSELEQGLKELSDKHLIAPADLDQPTMQQRQATHAILLDSPDEQHAVPVSELIPLDGKDRRFRAPIESVTNGLEEPQAALVCRGLALALRPSAVLDLARTRESAELAYAREPDVPRPSTEGRIILAKGSEVDLQHIEDLLREHEQYRTSRAGRIVAAQRFGGLAVLLLIIMAGGTIYAGRYRPELLSRRLQVLSFALLTLALVAMARLCIIWGITPLWAPVPLMVMIMCLVYNQAFGLGVAVFYALLVRLTCPGADYEFFVLLMGGLMAALLSGQIRTRSTLIKAGLLAGIAQFCAVWALGLMSALDGVSITLRFWESGLLGNSLAALTNGLMSGFVVSGILPSIEKLFGVTTDIRLLEWSDPNQPLLQRLLLDAPGSYYHSMVVGSLAADAAEVVGADPLLARVSAYFHDVGKLRKPEYFAENLARGAKNPHDELSPTMSSLIITAHPKDGAEMAEEYGVPRVVRNIILQSHGSSVLKYFWDKAQEGENGEAEERSFRYRLPKPQSKEAAIVMLCDAVESAARSMDSPSVGQLRSLVRQTIRDRLNDGQLDESGLTITDLKGLEDCLVYGLSAVFHNRVSYPGQEELAQDTDGGAEAAGDEETPKQNESNAGGNLQQSERS